MTTLVSDHARSRAAERVGTHRAQALFAWLWRKGRRATALDFKTFETNPRPGRDYRVAEREGALYLVARSSKSKRFITLIKRSELEQPNAIP